MTNSGDYTLRIQMWDTDSNYAEVIYGTFRLSDKDTYNLEVGDFVEPNAYGLMDDLKESNGAPFDPLRSSMRPYALGSTKFPTSKL